MFKKYKQIKILYKHINPGSLSYSGFFVFILSSFFNNTHVIDLSYELSNRNGVENVSSSLTVGSINVIVGER
jgi:hypothetical protein